MEWNCLDFSSATNDANSGSTVPSDPSDAILFVFSSVADEIAPTSVLFAKSV
jgi:hypothetical protein